MSSQQLFLLVLCTVLAIGAVPGLIMGPPARPLPVQSSQSTQGESKADTGSANQSSPGTTASSGIPETRLILEQSTTEEKEKIRFARKININEAGKDRLLTIKGLGPATAEKILNFRRKGNVFYRVEHLDQIDGIGTRTIEDLRPYVTVGKKYRSRQSEKNESENRKIDLNTADQSRLTTLPGVGTTTAERILGYREQYGGFRKPSDLKNITGIGDVTYQRIEDKVKTSPVSGIRSQKDPSFESRRSSAGGSVNVNNASKSDLESLTGIGPVTAGRIVNYREENGSFGSIDDLKDVKGIGSVTVEKLKSQATAN